ncbi:unnamed protein product [Sphagnum tenellum]
MHPASSGFTLHLSRSTQLTVGREVLTKAASFAFVRQDGDVCVATASVTESGSFVAASITGVRTLVSGLGVVHCIASKQAIFGTRVFSTGRRGKVRPGIGEVEFQTDAEEPLPWFLFVHLPPKLGMAKAGMTNTIAIGIAVQSNWDNRQFSSSRSLNVHRLFEFLLQSESATKSKMAVLNEKLTTLEQQLEFLEAQLCTAVDPS